MLRIIRRHTLEAFSQVMRVAVNYRRGQKLLKKLLYIERIPWPDHISTTERTLKSSRKPHREIQSASRSPVYFHCLYNRIKSLWKTQQVLDLFFEQFWQQINEKSSLGVETCIKTHCCTHCLICFSIQVIFA